MKLLASASLSLLLIAPHTLHAGAPELKPLWLVPDQVIFTDDFSQHRGEVKARRQDADAAWIPNQGTRWEVTDGVLRGHASSAEYQTSHDTHKGVHPRIVLAKTPEKYVLRFSMRLIDGIPFEAGKRKSVPPFIEIGHHICRVTWDVNGAALLADGDTTQLAADRDFKFIPGKWQDVMVERRDDEVLVQFASGPTFHGKHPTYRSELHAVMLGGLEAGTMEVDNVTVWSVKDGVQPSWTQTLAKLPPQEVKVLHEKRPGQLAKEKKEAEAKTASK